MTDRLKRGDALALAALGVIFLAGVAGFVGLIYLIGGALGL